MSRPDLDWATLAASGAQPRSSIGYDAIVIGAGPAGNSAALRLASLGRSALVIDSRTAIGDKLCTGIVGKECVERYPPDASHVRCAAKSAVVVSPAGRRYTVSRDQPQAYIIDRVAYVESLARKASEAGATYLLGARVADISISRSDVEVTVRHRSSNIVYRAQAVIVATGFGSPLLRKLGFKGRRQEAFLTGSQVTVTTDGLKDTEVYLGDQIAPGSFGWLVPVSATNALAGIVSSQRPNGHMGGFLTTLRESGRIGESIDRPKQWGIPLKPLGRTYGRRVVVVGDAAGQVKPTTGGGIYYALLSGEIAAETIDEALLAGDPSESRLKGYEERWRATFGTELKIGYCARLLYEALGDRQIEKLLSDFMSMEVQESLVNSAEFSFDWHGRLILKALRRTGIGGLIRSFGPRFAPLLARLMA